MQLQLKRIFYCLNEMHLDEQNMDIGIEQRHAQVLYVGIVALLKCLIGGGNTEHNVYAVG